MNPNELASEGVAVGAVIDPDVLTATAFTSTWMSMEVFENAMAIVMAGTLGSSATLDAKLLQATDASGTGSKDITGKAITQLTQAGTDSDKQAIINCRAEELDLDNDFDHIAISLTVAVATSDACAVLLGLNARYKPASDNDVASVDEIVA